MAFLDSPFENLDIISIGLVAVVASTTVPSGNSTEIDCFSKPKLAFDHCQVLSAEPHITVGKGPTFWQ